jgi:dihydrofolate reductase
MRFSFVRERSSSILFLCILHLHLTATAAFSMKTSVYIATTLDGFIASPSGSIDFLNEYQTSASPEEDGDMGFSSFLSSVDLLIMGRKTWDQVVEFGEEMWPYGQKDVWIWSRNAERVVIPECRRGQACAYSLTSTKMMELAKEKGYTHIYVDGGTTIQEFQRGGFIDEYILSRVPLILGGGIPLFENQNEAGAMKMMVHLETKSFSNGIVQSHYQVKR